MGRKRTTNPRLSKKKWNEGLRLTAEELPYECELRQGIPFDSGYEERMRLFEAEMIKAVFSMDWGEME